MKSFATRYLNDIVSLTVLLLMAVAFVGAQANAVSNPESISLPATAAEQFEARLEALIESSDIQADVSVDLDLLEIKLKVKH